MREANPGGKTIAKAFSILRLVASSHNSRYRLMDIARICGLDKSTASRLFKSLLSEGALIRDTDTTYYRLGPLLFELGLAALPAVDLRAMSKAEMNLLASVTEDTAFLVQRSGYATVCLDHRVGTHPVQTLTVGIGDHHPLGIGAGGLAILAALDNEQIRTILKANNQLYIDYGLEQGVLLQQIEESRAQGFAFNEGHATPGAAGLGSPIFDRNGQPVGAIFVASITERMIERKHEVAKVVIQMAKKITDRYQTL